MACIWIELKCQFHGIERYRVKVIRRYNMKSNIILPVLRSKPKKGLKSLLIGRNVSIEEAEKFLWRYFRQMETNATILKMKTEIEV